MKEKTEYKRLEQGPWGFEIPDTEEKKILIGEEYPDEDYVILKCADFELKIGYTAFHGIEVYAYGASSHYRTQLEFKTVWEAILSGLRRRSTERINKKEREK